MTREELIAKIEKHREDDYEYLHNVTRRVIDNFHGVLSEPYYCPEKTGLHIYLTEISYILEIMRPDLLDHDVLARIKYLIGKRLNAIENE